MAIWRSPSRSSAAARGATFGSMAACPSAMAGAAAATRAMAQTRRRPRPQPAGRTLRWRKVASMNALRWYVTGPLARGRRPGRLRPLKRDVAMLPRRIPVPLGPERPQRIDEARPGVARVDHVVDVPACRGGVRVGELRRVVVAEPGRRGRRIAGLGDLVLEQNL